VIRAAADRPPPGLLAAAALLAVLAAGPARADEASWTVRRTDDGIEVATRPVNGSAYAEVRARAKLDAPLAAVVALLRDKSAAPRWIAYCAESRVVATVSGTEVLTYTWNDMPWPVRDRDVVMRVRWFRDPDSGVVRMAATAEGDAVPHVRGRTRIETARTGWTLTPLPGGGVHAEFRSHVDPASAVPAWLSNALVVGAPHDTLRRMRAVLAEGAYSDASVDVLE
jgi:hypothetical protein